MSDSKNTSSGVGFTGLLTVLFIGLRLGKVIDWSWWWVLSPLWISAGITGVVIVVCLAILAVTDR